MINFYAGDITNLSDEELKTLEQEIWASGVLDDDDSWEAAEQDAGDWDVQARKRFDAIRIELNRRWELANPEEAEKRRKFREFISPVMQAQTAYFQNLVEQSFERASSIEQLYRKASTILGQAKPWVLPFTVQ